MTRTVEGYLSLLTSQHRGRPLLEASLRAVLEPVVAARDIVRSLPSEFSLDDATGVQLDAVGLWVGLSRVLLTPLENVYFTLDDQFLGLDLGIWTDPTSPLVGPTRLDDGSYRKYLRLKIASNRWDGRSQSLITILQALFPDNPIVVQDNFDMTMTIGLAGPPLDAVERSLLREAYLPLRPLGIGASYIVASGDSERLFAFDAEGGVSMAGFDLGSWGVDASSDFAFRVPFVVGGSLVGDEITS